MTGNDLAGVFAPVVTEILALVKDQVSASTLVPSAILLVGGFGANPYLREQLKGAFPTIRVMQPPGAWTCVSKGALVQSMAEASTGTTTFSIMSRIARKHFGIEISIPFVHGVHKQSRKTWAAREGYHHVTVVSWMVSKGQTIKELEPVTANFYSTQRCSDGPIKSQVALFYSFDGGVAPRYADMHGVKHLVTLKYDLSVIPVHRYQIITGADHKKYYQISYEIKITFFSAHMDYSLWFQGKNYGAVQAVYS